jgi:hypothetical protein
MQTGLRQAATIGIPGRRLKTRIAANTELTILAGLATLPMYWKHRQHIQKKNANIVRQLQTHMAHAEQRRRIKWGLLILPLHQSFREYDQPLAFHRLAETKGGHKNKPWWTGYQRFGQLVWDEITPMGKLTTAATITRIVKRIDLKKCLSQTPFRHTNTTHTTIREPATTISLFPRENRIHKSMLPKYL